jgi:hypothetical protein
VGAPLPLYEKGEKALEEKECKAIKGQASNIYRHFMAGAGAELLAHTFIALGSIIANLLGYLAIPPKDVQDILGISKGGAGDRMFTREDLLLIVGKGTELAIGQMTSTNVDKHIYLSTIGAVQRYILEALAVAQTGKSIRSAETGMMITHYLNMLNSDDDGGSAASVSEGVKRQRAASSVSRSSGIASAAPMSASPAPPPAAASPNAHGHKKQRIAGAKVCK